MSFKASHLRRYKDVTNLLIKFGRMDFLKDTGLAELFVNKAVPGVDNAYALTGTEGRSALLPTPLPAEAELLSEIERLGPTFVELGKLLSHRPDIVPMPYLEALSKLDEHVMPLSFAEVEEVIRVELVSEIIQTFKSFEPQPISSGSIGQVHRATLMDGRRVIVKVQRPGVRERIYDDLEALEEIADLIDRTDHGRQIGFRSIVTQLRKVLISQLDYRQEAHNLKALRRNLKNLRLITIPEPIEHFCSPRVLTMTHVEGQKISELVVRKLSRYRRNELAEQTFVAYLQQMLEDGFVDADPAPDNVLLTSEGNIALLDMGEVARISPQMQDKLLQILGAIDEGRSDQVAELVLTLAERRESCNENSFRKELNELVLVHKDMAIENLEIGNVLSGIAQASIRHGLALPAEFAIVGSALVTIDHIAHIIEPNFDANGFIRKNMADMVKKRMIKSLSPVHMFQNVIESAELVERLPSKLGRIMDALAGNNLKITVDAIDEDVLMTGFQKIANRITVGLVLAALIIGAALMMRIETTFRIFGYPGIAMLCFLLAGGTGLYLVMEILLGDRKRH